MKHVPRAAVPIVLLSLALAVGAGIYGGPAAAQESESDAAQSDKEARQEAKRQEREARIEEYLRKKEERRAQREMERQLKAQQQQAEADAIDLATFSDEPHPASPKTHGKEEIILPPRLARMQEILRGNPLGQDPTVQAYLDLIDLAEASPQQLAAFGNFLSDSGWPEGAIEYYLVALSIEQEDPILWMNAGTVHRQLGQHDDAVQAYRRALSIDPNNAFAHYNLGAVYDVSGKYEPAVEEYKIALTIDPTLGDPRYNPQAAHNERLLAVKLMLYKEQAGHLGLPLVEVPGGGIETEPEEEPSNP